MGAFPSRKEEEAAALEASEHFGFYEWAVRLVFTLAVMSLLFNGCELFVIWKTPALRRNTSMLLVAGTVCHHPPPNATANHHRQSPAPSNPICIDPSSLQPTNGLFHHRLSPRLRRALSHAHSLSLSLSPLFHHHHYHQRTSLRTPSLASSSTTQASVLWTSAFRSCASTSSGDRPSNVN